jgi:Uma2 family endonuclease
MLEYVEAGVRLGWLLDWQNRTATIYRQDETVETLSNPITVSGEDVLLGFTLDFRALVDDR